MLRALVHVTRPWREFLQGELAHALPEQAFVLGQRGQCRGQIDSRRGHGGSSRMGRVGPAGRARPGVEREQSRTGNASNRDAIITLTNDQARLSECCRLPDAVGDARRRSRAAVVRAGRPDPSRADQSAAPGAAARAAEPALPPAGTAAAAGPERAAHTADLPHGHQLRSRRRDRHRQAGTPRRRPEARGLRGHGGRQAAVHRDLQAHSRRRQPAAGRGGPARDQLDLRRGVRGAP